MKSFRALALFTICAGFSSQAWSFAYVLAGDEPNNISVNAVTHAGNYNGVGGTITIDIGVLNTSPNAADMLVSTENVARTWNNLIATNNNLTTANVPGGFFDFESVLLHEVGHSLGLAHPNLASESGLSGSNTNYTKAQDGADDTFNLNAGADGVIGSGDDIRGDDVNLNWFNIANNNPFDVDNVNGTNGVVDSTTYSRDIADLTGGDTYSANGDRAVATLLGEGATESVQQQGTFSGEAQRTLAADDVAGIMYAETGVDEIAGTADDYDVVLNFVGLTTSADILISFDNAETGFASSNSSLNFVSGTSDHLRIISNEVFFNTGHNWFFNQVSNEEMVPAPLGALLLAGGLALLSARRRRQLG